MGRTDCTVLFVDDDAELLRALKRSLGDEDYEVITASSADEAADTLNKIHVHVIVSDEQMPGMSGTQLLALVQRQHPDVVRIVLSGSVSVPVAVRAVNEGGVFRILTKPCSTIDLALAIREALDENARLEQSRDRASPADRSPNRFDQARVLDRLQRFGADR